MIQNLEKLKISNDSKSRKCLKLEFVTLPAIGWSIFSAAKSKQLHLYEPFHQAVTKEIIGILIWFL